MTKLFVVAHKDVYIPASTALVPLNPDYRVGDNIAEQKGYSELRAHYFIWKNEPAETEIVGFFQFRRYLNLSAPVYTDLNSLKRPLPYRTRKYPNAGTYSQKVLDALGFYDVIAPIREFTGSPVLERYAESEGHRGSDLRLTYEIVSEKYPEYLAAADTYLNGSFEYFGNLYIMRRTVYNDYCAWLFDILGEFSSRVDEILPRTQGYLAERLFGIWFTRAYTEGKLRCAELPRTHFWGYDDENHNLRRDKLINILLPPGTKIRANIRRLVK